MMTLVSLDGSRRKHVTSVISQILSPAQMTMAHQLMAAEKPGRPAPQAEELLFWIRLNMPVAAARIDAILHPAD
jgi:hypothetical protein